MYLTPPTQNLVNPKATPVTASDRPQSAEAQLPWNPLSEAQLFYQPVFGLRDSRLLGFEVSLHPSSAVEKSSLPTQLRTEVEGSQYLEELKWNAFEQVCCQLHQWHDRFPRANSLVLRVALFSSETLRSRYPERADEILTRYRIAGTQIRLELLDGASVGTSPTATTPFRIQHYFNDLYSDSSRLSSLYQCPTGALKIKACFINNRQWTVLQGLFALAADLDLEAIAEGVDEETDLANMEALAGHHLRGYTRSQRLTAEEATALMTAHFH
ncbi:MAG: EAL domain-containing protein [Cyanobacteriota bacterium]|nr:EAL domain-containing protein [Cyanobacteriota bacterium]